MKQTTLVKLQQPSPEDAFRLLYPGDASFCGSPLVQLNWSLRGVSHEIEPNHHCMPSVIGVLDFRFSILLQAAHVDTSEGLHIAASTTALAAGDGRPTVIVLGNASVRHGIDEARRQRRLIEISVSRPRLPEAVTNMAAALANITGSLSAPMRDRTDSNVFVHDPSVVPIPIMAPKSACCLTCRRTIQRSGNTFLKHSPSLLPHDDHP